MASSSSSSPGVIPTHPAPYRMSVQQRYLDLTRQKLELTRLPREPRNTPAGWDLGVSKIQLEPLVDYWTENYDWRIREAFYNEALPQFRVGINGSRIHFVHRPSPAQNAIPLLFVCAWPESILAISRIIDSLCNDNSNNSPQREEGRIPSFHVVAPSIPGTGFSDVLSEDGNNMATTADVFDGLMKSLGYHHYIAHGSGWGFRICRMIALRHSESCLAIHASNIGDPVPSSGFGYTSGDFSNPSTTVSHFPLLQRPQTMAYAFCDSPTGLLAYMVDMIRPRSAPTPTIRSSTQTRHVPTMGEQLAIQTPWSPTVLIDWTMIHWLPGPEVALRWLVNSAALVPALWASYSPVPLAITQFVETGSPSTPQTWVEQYQRVVIVRRRAGPVRFPAWEAPSELVLDIREFANMVVPFFSGVR